MSEFTSVEQASKEAVKWCEMHPGWQRICDIEDTDSLYKKWEELPIRERQSWAGIYRSHAKDAWEEFGQAPCKVPYGFISGDGKFYSRAVHVPLGHNFMMVFKTAQFKGTVR